MKKETAIWTSQEEDALQRLGDILIPGGAGMPTASKTELLIGTARVCEFRPDFVKPVKELIADLVRVDEWSIHDIQQRHPKSFETLSELLAGSYFLDENVAAVLDYRDRQMIPLDPEESRLQELEKLVAPVIARGNYWPTTP